MRNAICRLTVFAVAALAVSGAGPVQAGTILYFVDNVLGVDRMAEALANRATAGDTVTTVGASADFETQLLTGNYDLGIFMVQNFNSSSYSSAINTLGNFVAGGGRAIYAEWSRNNSLATQFGATFDGQTNQNQMTITDASLVGGLGAGAVSLSNPEPGWGVYSTGLIAGPGSNVAATFANDSGAIVIGNVGRSIVNGFLTDTFTDGAQGVQLYENQIGFLLDSTSVAPIPEPSSIVVLGMASVIVAFGARRRRNLPGRTGVDR